MPAAQNRNRERDEQGRLLPAAEPGEAGRRRVLAAIKAALDAGEPVTVAGVAREAHVNRVFIQRRPELRDMIREHGRDGGEQLGVARPVRLPPAVEALIEQQLGDVPWGRWLRDAAVEKIARDTGMDPDELDGEARRPAPRRRNYSERQRGEVSQ